jgi:hypothetical protein
MAKHERAQYLASALAGSVPPNGCRSAIAEVPVPLLKAVSSSKGVSRLTAAQQLHCSIEVQERAYQLAQGAALRKPDGSTSLGRSRPAAASTHPAGPALGKATHTAFQGELMQRRQRDRRKHPDLHLHPPRCCVRN